MKSVSNLLGTLAGNIYGNKPGSSNAAAAAAPNLRSRSGYKQPDANSAFAHMYENKYSFGTVSYPTGVDQMNGNGHYIMFYVLENVGTKWERQGHQSWNEKFNKPDKKVKKYGTQLDTGYTTSAGKVAGEPTLTMGRVGVGENSKSSRNSITHFTKAFQRTADVIIMYMPDQITDSSQLTYGASELEFAGAVTKKGIDLAQRVMSEGGLSLMNALKEGGGLVVGEAITRGLNNVAKLGNLVGGDVTGTINAVTGRVVNPHLEVLFKTVAMKEHGYTFTFTPKNEDEVKAAQQIIKLFKFHAAPDSDKVTSGRYLKVPSMFEIHYMYQGVENSWLNLIPPVVCKTVNIDYAAGGQYQTFRPIDGPNTSPPPTQIKMELQFMETEIMTKDRIAEGF